MSETLWMTLWVTAAGMFIGVLLGGLITWLVTHCYYQRAATDLANKAKDLEDNTVLMLRSLESAGLVELTWEGGKPKGMIISAAAKL